MTIETTAEETIIRIGTPIQADEIQDFLDYLRLREITSKSKATQEDVDKLAAEVNRDWWEKNKAKYLPQAK